MAIGLFLLQESRRNQVAAGCALNISCFLERATDCVFRECLQMCQRHHPLGQQPQCPDTTTFGQLAAGQGDEMNLAAAIKSTRFSPVPTPIQGRFQPFSDKVLHRGGACHPGPEQSPHLPNSTRLRLDRPSGECGRVSAFASLLHRERLLPTTSGVLLLSMPQRTPSS